MAHEKGNLSIHSENIFPIIKKWLYSDHDIFVRELISNASDAITKLSKLASMGEFTLPESGAFRIDVTLDPESKTLTFSDNGIGMTADEVRKYINQIAFSGAEDFLRKYKDKSDGDQIIGHFGLGFYSAFMVASTVEICSLSYQPGAEPIRWINRGGTEFEMETGERTERGTDIVLHLSEDGAEFLNAFKVRETILKYCSFMPHPIYFREQAGAADPKPGSESGTASEAQTGDSSDAAPEEKPLNTTHPLYLKPASEVSDEEYTAFYRSTFHDFREPLFWIHLNMDYPFNLKGILYFPKLANDLEMMDGQIKLYNAQVFVADNIKEVIPEFLMLLKGVIDCPDLPLNVSRSFLQNDGFVRKISNYISKKVSDKLSALFRNEREKYEGFWDDISPFIKFGALRDDKFREAIEGALLFRTDKGSYLTIEELRLKNGEDSKIYYSNDPNKQSQYIRMFNDEGIETVVLDQVIDSALISMLESRNDKLKFARVDSEAGREDESAETGGKTTEDELSKLFPIRTTLRGFKNADIPAVIVVDEEKRRMGDMMRLYGMKDAALPTDKHLVLNESSPVVAKLLESVAAGSDVDLIASYLYKVAQIGNEPLSPEEHSEFVALSNRILLKLMESGSGAASPEAPAER